MCAYDRLLTDIQKEEVSKLLKKKMRTVDDIMWFLFLPFIYMAVN